MAGNLHYDAAVNARPPHIGVEGMPCVMKDKTAFFEPSIIDPGLYARRDQCGPDIPDRLSIIKNHMVVMDRPGDTFQDRMQLFGYGYSSSFSVLRILRLEPDNPLFHVDFIPGQGQNFVFSHARMKGNTEDRPGVRRQ